MIPISYNVRSLLVRKTTTGASVIGLALVVLVIAGAIMVAGGVRHTLGLSGSADNAIVIRKGSDAELASNVDEPLVGLIKDRPEVARGADGKPLAVQEAVVVVALDRRGKFGVSNVTIRGVPDNVLAFRPEVRILEGRPARAGTDEAIVGKGIYKQFVGLELGKQFELKKNRPVKVVGVFDSGGSSFDSEVWVDLDTARTAFGREGLVSSVRVRLTSPAKLDAFAAAMESDKRLGLDVQRETVYYEKQSQMLATFLLVLTSVMAFFCAIGAMIGAAITMYASVANRAREIGTLRALGFSRGSILSSFLLESVLLALAGGVLGTLASLALGLVKFSMMNFNTWSEMAFHFRWTPTVAVVALVAACGMGILGGFFPAWRASRMSPLQAIRA